MSINTKDVAILSCVAFTVVYAPPKIKAYSRRVKMNIKHLRTK